MTHQTATPQARLPSHPKHAEPAQYPYHSHNRESYNAPFRPSSIITTKATTDFIRIIHLLQKLSQLHLANLESMSSLYYDCGGTMGVVLPTSSSPPNT